MDRDAFFDDLLLEWEERRARGETVVLTDLATDPEVVSELQRITNRLAACDRLLGMDGPTGPSYVTSLDDDELPVRIAHYEVRAEIGRGGMGVVYRAFDPFLGREVAVKQLRPGGPFVTDDQERQLACRFNREGQALARLTHPAIVPVHAAGLDRDRPYLVMEYVPGGSLADHRAAVTATGPNAIVALMEQVARGVAHAHAAGVVHRDLKPGNILLRRKSEIRNPKSETSSNPKIRMTETRSRQVSDLGHSNLDIVSDFGFRISDLSPKVTDFGLAMLLDPTAAPADAVPESGRDDTVVLAEGPTRLTTPGPQPGTAPYMAPEQFDPASGRRVGPAADVWALGVMLYELLAGKRPFDADTWGAWRQKVCDVPPPPLNARSGLARRLAHIAAQCLEKDPARRPTAAQLADSLRRATRPVGRWLAAAAVAACLAVGSAFALWPDVTESLPTWPDLPAVRHKLAELEQGRQVVLIDRAAPDVFHLPTGPESGTVWQRDPEAFTVDATAPLCMIELLPWLRGGRYRIEAELRHTRAQGLSWVGAYVASWHGHVARGPQHTLVAARFADRGSLPQPPPVTSATDGMTAGHAQLVAYYHGASARNPYEGMTTEASRRGLMRPPDPNSDAPWRTVVLTVDSESIAAESQVSLGSLPVERLARFRGSILNKYADLKDVLAVNPHGSIGVAVFSGAVSVRRFVVTPIP